MAETICRECREAVSEQASNCPHCGYNAATKHEKYARNRLIIGLVLALTIVGSPVALLFFWMSRRSSKRAKKATVGAPA